VNNGLLKKLQTVQSAAAHVTTESRKFDHIRPVLRELHWLSVRKRIVSKLAMRVYKCLLGLVPARLVVDCQWPAGDISGLLSLAALLFVEQKLQGTKTFCWWG